MKECTETDKPLVSIVLATYNPRMDWFREQLNSLNNQSYDHLELLIIDDCSAVTSFKEIQNCVEECMTRIPYKIYRNQENLGSTKTFEKLTTFAGGDYIAYCDQDDIWHKDKIEVLLNFFNDSNIKLAFSDVQVIDESGNQKADSITLFRKRHVLYGGCKLSDKLILQNFVIGCSMLIKRQTAQDFVPFITDMVHDHYLALMSSLDGALALCKQPLVSYRIHKDNQTNVLTGVRSKEDYYIVKVKTFLDRIAELENRKVNQKIPGFEDVKKWATARALYYRGDNKAAKLIWQYRHFDFGISAFELITFRAPDCIFRYALKQIKKGKF